MLTPSAFVRFVTTRKLVLHGESYPRAVIREYLLHYNENRNHFYDREEA